MVGKACIAWKVLGGGLVVLMTSLQPEKEVPAPPPQQIGLEGRFWALMIEVLAVPQTSGDGPPVAVERPQLP